MRLSPSRGGARVILFMQRHSLEGQRPFFSPSLSGGKCSDPAHVFGPLPQLSGVVVHVQSCLVTPLWQEK